MTQLFTIPSIEDKSFGTDPIHFRKKELLRMNAQLVGPLSNFLHMFNSMRERKKRKLCKGNCYFRAQILVLPGDV